MINKERLESFIARLGFDKTKKEIETHMYYQNTTLIVPQLKVAIDTLRVGDCIGGEMLLILGCVISQLKDVPITYFMGN